MPKKAIKQMWQQCLWKVSEHQIFVDCTSIFILSNSNSFRNGTLISISTSALSTIASDSLAMVKKIKHIQMESEQCLEKVWIC